jgi:hypothetical protein
VYRKAVDLEFSQAGRRGIATEGEAFEGERGFALGQGQS